MGVLVDGKAVNWNEEIKTPTLNFQFNEIKKNADTKCAIAAKAMEGAKLDVCKFVPDGHGGFTNGPIVPVKTDMSMNTETRSFWTILKQLFGFVVTLKDKVKAANEAQRDYQIDPANAKTVSAARRSAEVTQIRNALARHSDNKSKLDLDFFSGAYNAYDKNRLEKINEGILSDLTYTDYNGVTRDAYNRYLLDRVQNIEKVCANSYDTLIKQPITRLDPSNHREFTDNFIKQYALGKMAMDFSQSYATLKENKIAPTNGEAQKVTDRAGAVFSFTSGKIQPFIKLQGCLEAYLGYMSSDMYLSEKTDALTADKPEGQFAYSAGKAKGILSCFYNNSDDMRTVADYLDDKKVGYEVSALSFMMKDTPKNLGDNACEAFAKYYLPSENPDFSLVMINDDTHVMLNQGIAERYYSNYNDVKNEMRELETAMDKYDEVLTDKEKELPFLEKYDAIARKTSINAIERKENVNERISFNDLFENKTPTALTNKPKAAEKSMSMGGMKM